MNGCNSIGRRDICECVLCAEPNCSKACKKNIDPGKILRSVWFNNADGASLRLDSDPCKDCDKECERACVKRNKVEIGKTISRLYEEKCRDEELSDFKDIDYSVLKSDICGIEIENPFLLSSSVVASNYDMCARAFEAGWAGVCFKTISTLDIHETSPRFSALEGDNGTFIGFKNIEQLSDHSVEENMSIFRELKANYPNKFILASIMGQNEAEWGELARKCEENGADAIELNFSCPNMAEGGLGSDIGQVPQYVERFTRAAKSACTIPVIAKLTPNVDNMSPAAIAARNGGADGISAINTIKSITGVNIHTYVAEPPVRGKSAFGGYSGAAVKPIALRFIAELGKNKELRGLHISGMGGIENWNDAVEFILLGAGSIQITTAVMKYGYRIIEDLKEGLALYMNLKGFKSIEEMIGLGLDNVFTSTDSLERDTILFPKFDQEKCIGCGRCVISCADGGHQALKMEDNRIKLDGKKCVGCHLCLLVCPEKAISSAGKRITRI